jgi:hypothetical protein
MDSDGDLDVLFSDRKQQQSGVYWLENAGPDKALGEWQEHPVGGIGREVMFLDLADLDQDGLTDVVVATKPQEILFLRRTDRSGVRFETHSIPFPTDSGTAKAVSVGDINADGRLDLVISCEEARSSKQGVRWLEYEQSPQTGSWKPHPVSGVDGIKYDLVPLVDLDQDGDLDVVTSEETRGLGVIWYENPLK